MRSLFARFERRETPFAGQLEWCLPTEAQRGEGWRLGSPPKDIEVVREFLLEDALLFSFPILQTAYPLPRNA